MTGIKLAYYKKKLETILGIYLWQDSMHDTWKEWHKAYLKTKNELISQGFVVNDFVVDIDELLNYCTMKGIKNDGKARS